MNGFTLCSLITVLCPRCSSYQIIGCFILTFWAVYAEMSFFPFLFPAWQKYLTGFSSSIKLVRWNSAGNWMMYSQMQTCMFKYMPCLLVCLLVGAIVSPAQKNIALSHIIIHKGSFLSYFCSCTIFMIAIWYLSSFKVIKWLKILLLTSRCNI